MDPKLFATVFSTIFVAELGDKTQLATFLYAANARNPKLTVLAAAAAALVLASSLGVLAGSLISSRVNPKILSWVAGSAFVVLGIWTIVRA